MNRTKWISSGRTIMPANALKENGSYLFRKDFTVSELPVKAELKICALGLGEYRLNGQAVTDEVLCTPFTQYDKRVIYQVYDVTGLLVMGENVLAAHVGNGFYNNNMYTWNDVLTAWKDVPKLFAHLTLTFASGEQEIIRTDRSWKWADGPSIYNHMRQGEICDASLRQPGYDTAGFDDAAWKKAAIAHEPGGAMETTDMPPIKVIRTLQPVKIAEDIYDFGENISGWAKVTATGEKGQEIRLIYDDKMNPDGSFFGNCGMFARMENMTLCNEDVFILSGAEKEEFRPTFCYHGFRYVKVENAPADFTIEAEVVHTDLKKVGNFRCDNEMLNKIHEACVRATLANYVGIPTDCPHREQNGWTGDAQLSSNQALLNFDIERAYAKWLRDFKDAQRGNGQLPGIIPCAGWGYNWGSGPAWDSALFLIPWNVYVTTKKTAIIEDLWENMVLYMAYFERMAEDDIACFGLGDWVPVKEPIIPTEVTDTAYFYVDMLLMGKMAEVLGKDSSYYFKRAKEIKETWRKNFWLGERRKELEGFQTFWGCAIYQGLLEEEEIPEAARRLAELVKENDYHIDCGILGTQYIFSSLSDHGYADVLYKMVTNPEYPSYAYWINQGSTTLCEDWKMASSQNHHMFSEVDRWLYRYVGGIQLNEDGVVIKPLLIPEVNEVTVEHNGIKVERKGKQVTVTLPMAATIDNGSQRYTAEAGTHEFILA